VSRDSAHAAATQDSGDDHAALDRDSAKVRTPVLPPAVLIRVRSLLTMPLTNFPMVRFSPTPSRRGSFLVAIGSDRGKRKVIDDCKPPQVLVFLD
jgi:hypothetical protein